MPLLLLLWSIGTNKFPPLFKFFSGIHRDKGEDVDQEICEAEDCSKRLRPQI